jgi:beta-lactamase class A
MRRSYLIVIAAVAVAFGAGFGVAHWRGSASADNSAKAAAAYPLLAKRIFIDNPNDTLVNFTSLRRDLRSRFDAIGQPYSFYFEYLPTGTTIRLNGEKQLVAASLVKLPLVMNLYHAAELGRINLDDSFKLTADDLDPAFGELYKRGAGTSMTYREAAKIALAQSDNTAARAINRSMQGKLSGNEESLPWLDIDYDTSGGEAVISSRGYSSIFKCLYLSCYLKPAASQEILTYLTESAFSNRITKYTPKDLKVAHKIGVYNPTNVHSDCGIFYLPQRQYLLCIMMEGDETAVNQTMADTSKQIYDWVSGR